MGPSRVRDGAVRYVARVAHPADLVDRMKPSNRGLVFAAIIVVAGALTITLAQARVLAQLIGYTLAELALMDLAVRATPAGSEGLGFALMVSVRNLALFGTDRFGSMLLDSYHVTFDALVVANAVTTGVAVPLALLLPRVIVGRRDG